MAFPKGKKRPKGAGRKAGTPNKATTTARDAIARVADGNAEDFMRWLQQTAEGIREDSHVDTEEADGGSPKADGGSPKWILRPNPEGAANLYLKAIEYHIPKLARTELTGKDGETLPAPATIIINQ